MTGATPLEIVRSYFRAIEANASEEVMREFFAPEIIQEEFPNRLVPEGARRDLAALMDASRKGRAVVERQRYEVLCAVESGDTVAAEVQWSATMRMKIGSLAAGDVMRARFAVFLTLRDGRITSQRNYDCFEPF